MDTPGVKPRPTPVRQESILEKLRLRAQVVQGIRRFFEINHYLEVETPYRIPAPPPEAHIDAQPAGGWFLHTSPELCMKRLLSAGYPRIFQIGKCFRRNERGKKHLPEFTLLEWYTAGVGYLEMMAQCEELIRFAVQFATAGHRIGYQGAAIDLSGPWPRLTVKAAFSRLASLSLEQALDSGRFDDVLAFEIEPRLGLDKPLFLYDYPAVCGSLAKSKPGDPAVVERFELYIGGVELCNAFSELADAAEQRSRFEEEIRRRRSTGSTVYPMPIRFLEALEQMPQAAGNALGIDRLVMLLADTADIADVVAFTPEEL